MIRAGDTVTVRSGFGREAAERVVVLGTGSEAGREVIDYIDRNGAFRWAYLEQIEAPAALAQAQGGE